MWFCSQEGTLRVVYTWDSFKPFLCAIFAFLYFSLAYGKSHQKPAGFWHYTFGIVLAIADCIEVESMSMSLLKSNLRLCKSNIRLYHAYIIIILYLYLLISVFTSSLATYYWYLYPNQKVMIPKTSTLNLCNLVTYLNPIVINHHQLSADSVNILYFVQELTTRTNCNTGY